MIAHLALPTPDPFSFTMPGAPWVAHEWLAELVMAGIQGSLGWAGLALVTALLFALSILLLTQALRRRFEPLTGLVLVLGSILLLGPHLFARAHVIAMPLMVVWCVELFAARDDGRAPSRWLLPVMVLWANIHGSYMFGLALTGFLAAEAVIFPGQEVSRRLEARRWGAFLGLAIASACVNANGVDGVLEPFRISAMPTLHKTFAEWRSPDFQTAAPLELWLLGMIFVGFATGAKLRLTRLLLLLGLIHVTLQHQRHSDLLAVAAPLAIAASLAPQLNRLTRSDANSWIARMFALPPTRASMQAMALSLGVAILFGGIALLHPVERQDSDITPGGALSAARAAGVSGPVLNNELFGGYLILSGEKVFIDGRMEMYGDDFLKRYMKLVGGDEAALMGALDAYGVTWTMLAPDDRALLIIDRLPGWRRIYADKYAVVNARSEPRPSTDVK